MQKELEAKLAEINQKLADVKVGFLPGTNRGIPIFEFETEMALKDELQSMKEWLEGMIANFCE